MSKLLNQWCIITSTDSMHPDDIEKLLHGRKLPFHTFYPYIVYQIIGADEDYFQVQDHLGQILRVKDSTVSIVTEPKFKPQSLVRLKKKPELIRKVLRLLWHPHNKEMTYQVELSEESQPEAFRLYWFEHQLMDAD